MMKLPTIFLGHGSPMNAIETSSYSEKWQALGEGLRTVYGDQIRAVLCISAHWLTRGSELTGADQPETIHDFYGFPDALYAFQYPAAGDGQLVEEIRRLPGLSALIRDDQRGLDHGAWSVLCHLFPQADVPVVQLSLGVGLSAKGHYELGEKLARLREQGVLIIGSGNVVHNLRAFRWEESPDAVPYEWAERVRETVNQALIKRNDALLLGESAYPEAFRLAAPTPDHFWPLFYPMGAAQGEPVTLFCDEIVGGSLSMTSVLFGAPDALVSALD